MLVFVNSVMNVMDEQKIYGHDGYVRADDNFEIELSTNSNCLPIADFSKITTEALKELLKLDPEELFHSIRAEVQRREDLAATLSSNSSTSSCCCQNICFGCCYTKTCEEFHKNLQGESHYILQVAGLGEVCTHPDYRERGLVKKVLTAAIEWCKANSIQISTLHTSNVPGLYESLGWKTAERHFVTFSITEQAQSTFTSLDSTENWMRDVYSDFNIRNDFQGWFIRSEKYEHWRSPNLILAIEADAYAFFEKGKDSIMISEICWTSEFNIADHMSGILAMASDSLNCNGFKIPEPVWNLLLSSGWKPSCADADILKEKDGGFMMRYFNDMSKNLRERPHVLWYLDRF